MTTMPARLRISFRKHTGGWGLAAGQVGYALWIAGWAWYWTANGPAYDALAGEIVATTVEAGLILAGFSLVASGMLLAFGYARGHRLLTAALIVGALAALATIAAIVSPAGESAMGVLLD
jgi:hypothetical protein